MTEPAPSVAVVGAGVIGAATARRLALRGARVWLLDRDDGARATTRVSFAWLNAHRKRRPDYHRLNVAGMAEHHVLAAGLDRHRRWHFPTGHLEFATEAEHAARLDQDVRELRALDYPAELVGVEAARAREPWVRIPAGAVAACYPSEGFALPAVLTEALIDHARALGAHVDRRAEVTGIDGGTVHLAGRPPLTVDRVVLCAGRWTGELAAGVGWPVPLVAPDGPASAATAFQARTAPAPIDVTGVVTSSVGNFRPDPGGRLVFQAHDLDDRADPGVPVPADVAAELAHRLTGLLRVPVEVERVSVGCRALPVDGYPVVGFLDPDRTVYAIATHSGLTLGPLLARLAAEELLDDRESELLRTFRPARFADGPVTAVAPLTTQGGD